MVQSKLWCTSITPIRDDQTRVFIGIFIRNVLKFLSIYGLGQLITFPCLNSISSLRFFPPVVKKEEILNGPTSPDLLKKLIKLL